MTGNERQRQTLIESLRVRFAKAVADNDADAKAALFIEAVRLPPRPTRVTASDPSHAYKRRAQRPWLKRLPHP